MRQLLTDAPPSGTLFGEEPIKMGRELIIDFEDLEVGMTVMVCGHFDGDVLLARQITVKYWGK